MPSYDLKAQFLKTLETLENLEEAAQSTPYTPEVYGYIKWRIAIELATALKKQQIKDPELIEKIKATEERFKEVAPKIVKYRYKLRDSDKKNVHFYFKEAVFKSLDQAEEYINTVPLKSYEIYQELIKFIELFDLAFPHLVHTAKQTIQNKILLLKRKFEIEGIGKEAKDAQKVLTNSLKSSLSKEEAEGAEQVSVEKGEEEKVKEILKEVKESVEESEKSGEESIISPINLPEEESNAEEVTGSENEPYITQHQEPLTVSVPPSVVQSDASLREGSAVSGTAAAETPQRPVPKQITAYPYWMWYPSKNLYSFIQIRYCKECGHILDGGGVCTSCGAHN